MSSNRKTARDKRKAAHRATSNAPNRHAGSQSSDTDGKFSRLQRAIRGLQWGTTIQLVGLIVAAIYCAVTFGLWQSSQRAELQTRQEGRAYLTVDRVGINGVSDDGRSFAPGVTLEVNFFLKNLGPTPAKNLKSRTLVGIMPHEPTMDDLGVETAGNANIGAGQEVRIRHQFAYGAPLTVQQAGAVNAGLQGRSPHRIYAVVLVDYTDVFGGNDRTIACVVYQSHGNFEPCRVLNDVR